MIMGNVIIGWFNHAFENLKVIFFELVAKSFTPLKDNVVFNITVKKWQTIGRLKVEFKI